ncbi:hypothetical protein RI056_13615 [Komagataeibacter nataicola]|uniref:hypothetical protein n=1 Tax=Komagataeibacter nataicola TaxID=265960 RepID=UPI0028B1594B|nr:hypothetical protein [Komagataeibacter nataicola]WNM07994.1 hypothetical protein RI056_13615 [Komagataeibacter nataicola]
MLLRMRGLWWFVTTLLGIIRGMQALRRNCPVKPSVRETGYHDLKKAPGSALNKRQRPRASAH